MLCVFGDAISFAPSIYQYLLSLKKFPLNFWSAFLLENLTKESLAKTFVKLLVAFATLLTTFVKLLVPW